MKIELKNISKVYEQNTPAVNNVSLNIENGEMMVLLGPSGCGKSTLLRMIAGLIDVTSGSILFDDRDVTKVPSQKRNTSMVFQSYALFPHLNVFDNIAFGLKIRGFSKSEIQHKVREMAEITGLNGLEDRKIQQLSGGQRQRVALARAIITKPDILLFDEPLSNLDEKLRVSMRQNIRHLQQEFGITSIYVTHDQEEAMSIADRITVMDNGNILQTDTPEKIYHFPRNQFVAEFVGQANLFDVTQERNHILGRSIQVPVSEKPMYAMLRPENIVLDSHSDFMGTVLEKENLGLIIRYTIQTDFQNIIVDSLNCSSRKDFLIGEKVGLSFNPDSVVFTQKYS